MRLPTTSVINVKISIVQIYSRYSDHVKDKYLFMRDNDTLILENLYDSVSNEQYEWVDVEDQEVMDGAWDLASNAPINILSDKELMGALEVIPSPQEGYRIIVGALFGSSYNEGMGRQYSFDIIVDENYQGKGIGRMLFNQGLNEAKNEMADAIHLEVHSELVLNMVKRAGFTHIDGVIWEKEL